MLTHGLPLLVELVCLVPYTSDFDFQVTFSCYLFHSSSTHPSSIYPSIHPSIVSWAEVIKLTMVPAL
jgi:hypothetical protein